MERVTRKKAIALISLVVILIVLLLLAGMVTYVSSDMITESKKIAFAKDTTAVYDAIQEYYSVNGDIPVLDGGIQMDAATYKSKITDTNFLTVLIDEINKNGDEMATFYEVDMSKIGIKDSVYGIKEDSDDIYLVSNISYVVYYYPGMKINKNIYFSNSYIVNK